jgi:hypothetical protein
LVSARYTISNIYKVGRIRLLLISESTLANLSQISFISVISN